LWTNRNLLVSLGSKRLFKMMQNKRYIPINSVGRDISLGREIVVSQVFYENVIFCEYETLNQKCCQIFKHTSKQQISVKDCLEIAAKNGWMLAGDKVVCGCHLERDLNEMEEYFKGAEGPTQ